MALIKVMSPADQPTLLRGEPAAALIKVGGRGLRGNDLKDFVKRAGHLVADALKGVDFKPGDVGVHNISLGASEFYGPNRNGDGFKEANCRKYYKTFEKYARAYRDHENKDPAKSYGVIKLALYNEPMHRIELIKAYNGTKEAAERNGGLVADKELGLLEKDGGFDTSMACKVPFDVCSVCGNHAKNRSEYCMSEKEGGHCKGGGLRSNIAGVLDDGTQVYADNPDPLWFDDSWVWRHADRIAAATGIVKSAAAGGGKLGGAALAESWGVGMPLEVALDGADELVKLAARLARQEEYLHNHPPHDSLGLAFCKEAAATHSWADHGTSLGDAFAALAAEQVVAPVEGFLEMVGGTSAARAGQVRACLPGVYGRMVADGSLEKAAAEGAVAARVPSGRARAWAAKRAADFSLDRGRMLKRAAVGAIYHAAAPRPRKADVFGFGPVAEGLARGYALYKLAFLRSLPEQSGPTFDWACEAVVRGNYY